VLADAELDGDLPGDAARVVAGPNGLVFAFRLGERATWRLLATRTANPDQSPPGQLGPPVAAPEVQASALRGRLAPLAAPLLPAVTGRRRLVAGAFRVLSQVGVSYRHSPLSVEGTPRRRGGPRAGDRLPDQLVTSAGRTVRLHDLLARPGVHLLLDRDADPPGALPLGRFVSIHRLTSSPGRGLIAVRPDGYVGFRGQTVETNQPAAWLAVLNTGASCPATARDTTARSVKTRTARPVLRSAPTRESPLRCWPPSRACCWRPG
jgi:hypothetical protein